MLQPFNRATSLPVTDSTLRRSLDGVSANILGPCLKSRRMSMDLTRASGTDYMPSTVRAERAGVTLEVGRGVDLNEQRQRLERNWNTDQCPVWEKEDDDASEVSSISSDSNDMQSILHPRQRLEQRWSSQSRQTDMSGNSRTSSKQALKTLFQARRARLKGRKALRGAESHRAITADLRSSSSGSHSEREDQEHLAKLKAELEFRRMSQARASDKETLGGLDSWGNVGLLSRESEAELGRIVQLGITAETSLSLMEEGRREPETSEQAQCPVSEDTLKLRVKNKEAAHYLLVQYNLRLLAKVAWQYRGRGMDIDDLIVEGTHGLTRAIEGFDPSKGNRFSTYAYNWIRQSIGRSISEHSRVVRLPAHVFEAIGRIARAKSVLSDRLDGQVSNEQVARAVGLSAAKVDLYMSAAQSARSLDDVVKAPSLRADQEGEQVLADIIEDSQPSADDMLIQDAQTQLMKQDIDSVLNGLSLRERNILRFRYGLHSEALSLTELSQAYGVSKERVRQIGEIALAKLQKRQLSNGEDLNNGRQERMPILKPSQYTNEL